MARNRSHLLEAKLDTLIALLQHLLVLELSRSGVAQKTIGKHLHVAKATVVDMLKGVKKEK